MLSEKELEHLRACWGDENHYYTDAEEHGATNAVQELLTEHDCLVAEVERLRDALKAVFHKRPMKADWCYAPNYESDNSGAWADEPCYHCDGCKQWDIAQKLVPNLGAISEYPTEVGDATE